MGAISSIVLATISGFDDIARSQNLGMGMGPHIHHENLHYTLFSARGAGNMLWPALKDVHVWCDASAEIV